MDRYTRSALRGSDINQRLAPTILQHLQPISAHAHARTHARTHAHIQTHTMIGCGIRRPYLTTLRCWRHVSHMVLPRDAPSSLCSTMPLHWAIELSRVLLCAIKRSPLRCVVLHFAPPHAVISMHAVKQSVKQRWWIRFVCRARADGRIGRLLLWDRRRQENRSSGRRSSLPCQKRRRAQTETKMHLLPLLETTSHVFHSLKAFHGIREVFHFHRAASCIHQQ